MSIEKKTITLTSSDSKTFEVDEAVALQSQVIKHVVEDLGTDAEIPVLNVTGRILGKVIEYCSKHVEEGKDSKEEKVADFIKDGKAWEDAWDDDWSNAFIKNYFAGENYPFIKVSALPLKDWEANFVKVEHDVLFDLILAANYMDIKTLLNLTCQTVANMIKGKNPEEIRKHFNINNDFTPEEEEEALRENQWAFE